MGVNTQWRKNSKVVEAKEVLFWGGYRTFKQKSVEEKTFTKQTTANAEYLEKANKPNYLSGKINREVAVTSVVDKPFAAGTDANAVSWLDTMKKREAEGNDMATPRGRGRDVSPRSFNKGEVSPRAAAAIANLPRPRSKSPIAT